MSFPGRVPPQVVSLMAAGLMNVSMVWPPFREKKKTRISQFTVTQTHETHPVRRNQTNRHAATEALVYGAA